MGRNLSITHAGYLLKGKVLVSGFVPVMAADLDRLENSGVEMYPIQYYTQQVAEFFASSILRWML